MVGEQGYTVNVVPVRRELFTTPAAECSHPYKDIANDNTNMYTGKKNSELSTHEQLVPIICLTSVYLIRPLNVASTMEMSNVHTQFQMMRPRRQKIL